MMPTSLSDQNPPKQIADIDLKIGTSKHLNIKLRGSRTNLAGLTSVPEAGIRRKVWTRTGDLDLPANPKGPFCRPDVGEIWEYVFRSKKDTKSPTGPLHQRTKSKSQMRLILNATSGVFV